MKPADPRILTINGGSSSIKFALFEAVIRCDGHSLIPGAVSGSEEEMKLNKPRC